VWPLACRYGTFKNTAEPLGSGSSFRLTVRFRFLHREPRLLLSVFLSQQFSDGLPMSERELFQRLAFHFGMGAAIGALFMTTLLVLNIQNLSHVVLRSPSPVVATLILVIGGSLYFAFNAAITGFNFILDEDYPDRGRR
jgi:hypothetical protein